MADLAAAVPAPERVGGLHFFNPAPVMKLVEVVEVGRRPRPRRRARWRPSRGAIGKEPVVTKDRPGFLVNRLLMPYLNQVVQDYDDGLASAEDLDAALELGLGYPMGGLKLLDLDRASTSTATRRRRRRSRPAIRTSSRRRCSSAWSPRAAWAARAAAASTTTTTSP